jgi:hypothetical protein
MSTPLRVIQYNCAKTLEIQESILKIANSTADILILQEIYIYPHGPTVTDPAFDLFVPDTTNNSKPRTATYISKRRTDLVCSLRSDLLPEVDGDVTLLHILAGRSSFYLYNIYNERRKLSDQTSTPYTVDRYLHSHNLAGPSIVAGDFNAHHSWWNSSIQHPLRTEKLLPWLTDNQLELINEPDVPTYHHRQNDGTSILDLTFATSQLSTMVMEWATDEEAACGSDHEVVRFSIALDANSTVPSPLCQRYNWKKADWEEFNNTLKETAAKQQAEFDSLLATNTTSSLDSAALLLTQWIHDAIQVSVPIARPCNKSKRWWTEELTEQRHQLAKAFRHWKKAKSPSSELAYKTTRTSYFSLIKETKRTHWHAYLEKLEGNDIWAAMRYTKPPRQFKTPTLQHGTTSAADFDSKCNLFRTVLFPTPPTVNKPYSVRDGRGTDELPWGEVTADEVKLAIMGSAPNKAPGPDGISFLCLRQVLDSIPSQLTKLYATLIAAGYHPHCWREATGAILKKAGKPDYTAPKAYRPVSLLNCLGKVAERIVAKRLSYLAETFQLLDSEQMGGRPGRSVMDAVLALVHDIQSGNKAGKVVSVLFLDVKGAFDHVNREQLLEILMRKGFPSEVLRWVDSFLTDRLIALAFDGQKEGLQPVATGIPQGSPVSPILFLFYLCNLFEDLKRPWTIGKLSTPSFIDDCALVVTGDSEESNSSYLSRVAGQAFAWAEDNYVQFDDVKIDLMHFHQKPTDYTPNCPVQISTTNIIKPSEILRWLGVWFDRKLSFQHHVQTRIASANRTWCATQRLANTEWGLNAGGMRKLYVSCIVPIAYFGAEAWWNGQVGFVDKLQKLQSTANRRILGAFRTTPVAIMDKEASNTPPSIKLDHMCRRFAYRVLRMPWTHPVRQRSPPTFPSLLPPPDKEPTDEDFEPRPINRRIIKEKHQDWQKEEENHLKFPSQLIRILHSLAFLVNKKTTMEPLPPDSPPWDSTPVDMVEDSNCLQWSQLTKQLKETTDTKWKEWWTALPDNKKGSSYFQYNQDPPTTKVSPHLHKLTRLQVSTITQFKTGHGYFKTYLQRQQPDLNTTCTKCNLKQPHSPEHILLHCTRYNQWRHLLGGRRTLGQLLGTLEGVAAVAEFVIKSGGGTRRGYQEMVEEEEE